MTRCPAALLPRVAAPVIGIQGQEPVLGLYTDRAAALTVFEPFVEMLLFFHVTDEPQLERFQTGIFYADGSPKPGLEAVARTADAASAGTIACRR